MLQNLSSTSGSMWCPNLVPAMCRIFSHIHNSGMWLKKKIEDYSQIQKGYYSGIAHRLLAYIVNCTDFSLFEVKDPYRPILYTNFVLFIFVTSSITLLLCQCMQKLAMHTLSVSAIALILIFIIFRHTNWPNNTQYWQKNGTIIHYYLKLTKAYLSLSVACLIK